MTAPARESAHRERKDMCPGVCRPWSAEDGLLVRLRLIGGVVSSAQLTALSEVAETWGDGRVHLTKRANLQVRALPGDGVLDADVRAALTATGLLPAPRRELMRNVMVSPQTGVSAGRADLRPVAADLDHGLRTVPGLDDLPGRFLFVLDDGRGDLIGRESDLGLVALDADEAQLRVGGTWSQTVPLAEAAGRLIDLAVAFAAARGEGPAAPWHVRELPAPLASTLPQDQRVPAPTGPLAYGAVPGGRHVATPEAGLTTADVRDLVALGDHLIVTPWQGVFIPEETLR